MLLGVPTIILGALSIIWNKRIHEAPHFTTWHGVSTPVPISPPPNHSPNRTSLMHGPDTVLICITVPPRAARPLIHPCMHASR